MITPEEINRAYPDYYVDRTASGYFVGYANKPTCARYFPSIHQAKRAILIDLGLVKESV